MKHVLVKYEPRFQSKKRSLNKSENRKSLGVALLICCVQVSCIMQELFQYDSSWTTYILYTISLFLISDWKSFAELSFSAMGGAYIALFGYLVMLTLFAIVGNAPLFGTGSGLIYMLFVLVFGIILSTNKEPFDSKKIARYLFAICGTLGVVMLFVMIRDGFSLDSLRFNGLSNGSDRATLSGIPVYFLFAFLCMKKSMSLNMLATILVIPELLVAFACNRRSSFLIAVIGVLLFCALSNKRKSKLRLSDRKIPLQSAITTVAVIVVIAIGLVSGGGVELLSSYALQAQESIQSAIGTILGVEGYDDASATIRNHNRQWALSVWSVSSFSEFLFGHGYNFAFIDFPILQAFVDMGIFGGIVWCFFAIAVPVAAFVKGMFDQNTLLFGLLYINRLVCFVYSGTCYGLVFLPILLLLFQVQFTIKAQHKDKV